MNRQDILQSISQQMEAMGRTMWSRGVKQLKANQPTHAQIGILMVVEHQSPQSVNSLAKLFHMTPSAVTQLVQGLVKARWLKGKTDIRDRRKTWLELTATGRKKLHEARKARHDMMATMFEPLSDAELVELERMHRKIIEHLQTLWTNNPTQK